MSLAKQARQKERQIELARRTLVESYGEGKRLVRERLSSRTALAAGFFGGVAVGLLTGGRRKAANRKRMDGQPVTRRAKESMPKHWLGHYIVWPFLLATARDLVVGRRPSRGS